MSGRDTIRRNIRKAIGTTGQEAERKAAVADRLARTPAGIIPQRGQLPPADRVALFIDMAEKAEATTERIGEAEELPEAVSAYLRAHNLPATVRTGADPLLSSLAWDRTQIEVQQGAARATDVVSMSHAQAAIAEAGALVLSSGPDNPTTLNFLPEVHIVVVRAEDVVGDYETVWAGMRDANGRGAMPRTVNLIAGPSRSADIEQKLQLGAHGPRQLHIVIVG